MIRLERPSIQSIFTRNERCDGFVAACLALGRRFGAIDVAGAVATNIWHQSRSAKLLKPPPNGWTLVLQQTRRSVSTKDGGPQSKGRLREEDIRWEIFSSLHSTSRSFSVPGLAQVRPRPFSARQGSRLMLWKHANHVGKIQLYKSFDSSCTSK
jgi:hypothetical protein